MYSSGAACWRSACWRRWPGTIPTATRSSGRWSPFVEISESTLYPILRRLEAGEMLSVYSVEHSGRLRKYYRITDKGRMRLAEFEEEWSEMVRIHSFIAGRGAEDE